MKKYLIIALSLALLLAFFGCGNPKEEDAEETVDIGDLTETDLTLPDASAKVDKEKTGENGSYMFIFTGEDFTAIKGAKAGSKLSVTYKSTVDYAVGEIGWIDIANAGPVISGNKKSQTIYLDIEDLVLGTDNFTIHMFNGTNSDLLEVTLYTAPDGYKVERNKKATDGGKKIVIPRGNPVPGNGDLSKADYKKIIKAADTAKLVLTFDLDDAEKDIGLLKFGPKSGDPYKHYGISKDGKAIDGNDGWRSADADGKITYTITEINAAIKEAEKDKPEGIFNKFEINMGKEGERKSKLVYIEIVGDSSGECTCPK